MTRRRDPIGQRARRASFAERRARALRNGMLTGCALSPVLIALVFATGSTFGQRCGRAHPGDPAAIATCVDDLSSGRRREP